MDSTMLLSRLSLTSAELWMHIQWIFGRTFGMNRIVQRNSQHLNVLLGRLRTLLFFGICSASTGAWSYFGFVADVAVAQAPSFF